MTREFDEPGRLHDKIPVEPLDEMRVARIERQLLAAVRPAPVAVRRAWVLPAGLGVAVGAAAAVTSLWVTQSPSPSVVRVDAQHGDARVSLEGSTIVARAGAQLEVENLPGERVVIHLDSGTVHCDVERRADRPPWFSVQAGEASVRVIGTAFSVERDGAEVRVGVERGVVEVEAGGQRQRVQAGQEWATAGFGVIADSQALPPRGEGPAVQAAETVARTDEAENAAVAVDQPPQVTRTQRPPTASNRDVRGDGGNKAELDVYSRPAGLDPIMPAPSADPREAERLYRELSLQPGYSDRAAYALYSLAHWQLYRLRKPREAAESAERYEKRFRNSTNAESLLWVRIAALCAGGEESRCRAAAHSYLRRYPGGRFAAAAGRVASRR